MSLLEDRILKIIELKEQGLDSSAIAENLGIDKKVVDSYYHSTSEILPHQKPGRKKGLREKNLERIRDLFSAGRTAEEIAKEIGLEKSTVRNYAQSLGIRFSSLTSAVQIRKIRSLALICPSVERIADACGLNISTVKSYASRNNIKLPKARETMLKRKQQIESCINNGFQYIEDVASSLHINPLYCYKLFYRFNMPPLPFRDPKNRLRSRNPRRKEVIDEIIREGVLDSLEKIGNHNKVGLTRERVRQYLEGTNQYTLWEETKKERKKVLEGLLSQILSIHGGLLSQIEHAGLKNASETDQLAYEKTKEYFEDKRFHPKDSSDFIFSLFKDYSTFQKQGKKVPLKWFAEKYDKLPPNIGKIFSRVGSPTLGKPPGKKRVATSDYKKECLERAVEIEMTAPDIGYFLGLPAYILGLFFNRYYKGDKQRPCVNREIIKFGKERNKRVTYRLASQVYEARDAGFSREEIMQTHHLDDKIYAYIMDHEPTISGHIVHSLQQLFPDKPVEKPYVSFALD
jgi:DNA-binding CsgD family transcriptional regulator